MTFKKGERAFDAWTLVHAAGGAAMGLLPLGLLSSLGLLVAYEVLEGGLRRLPGKKRGGGLFEHESWANITTDVIVAWIAWGIVEWRLDGWPLPLWWGQI